VRRIGMLMNIPGRRHPSVMQKWDGERKSRTSAPLKRVKTPTANQAVRLVDNNEL
jgi:hypothetical protein